MSSRRWEEKKKGKFHNGPPQKNAKWTQKFDSTKSHIKVKCTNSFSLYEQLVVQKSMCRSNIGLMIPTRFIINYKEFCIFIASIIE